MIKAIFIIFVGACVSSCVQNEGCVELTDDYHLWIVSAKERYLTKRDNIYLLGPRIESMLLYDGKIFGKNPKFSYLDFENIPGYFFIDPANGDYLTGLDDIEFSKILKKQSINKNKLVGPGEIMKERIEMHPCK